MISGGPARPTFSSVIVADDRGNALLAALMVSMLLAVLALSMSSNILTDFSMSNDLESQKKALRTADSGNSVLKTSLLGLDLSATLQAHRGSPLYQLSRAHSGNRCRQLLPTDCSCPSGSDEC